jgi:hypothetical protein
LPDLHILQLPEGLPAGWDLGDAPDDFDVEIYLRNTKNTELSTSVKKEPSLDKSEVTEYIEAINKEFAVVLRGSQVLIMRYWIGEEGTSRLTFLSTKDFHTLLANQQIFSAKEEKFVPVSQVWIRSPQREQFEDVYFRPCDKKYKTRYNLWRGFAVEPKYGDYHHLFLEHIFENICQKDTKLYNWVITWLSDLVQKPFRKPGTAIVLRGEMGTGKGQFARHIGKLFGQHFIPILHGGQLTSRFNSHLADKVLVFVDESGWSQDKYGAGVIRGMITEPLMAIEMKGKDIITMENYGHFIIAANSEWVVPASMHDERRFAVFNMGEEHRNDEKYFTAISEQLTNTRLIDNVPHIIDPSLPEDIGYQTLLHFLQNHKYLDADVRTIPQTEALADQKIRSMPHEFTWWHECLMYEKIGDFQLLDKINENWLPCDKFYDHYQKWCEKMRFTPFADNILPKNLKNMITLIRKRRIISNGERGWCYLLSTLTDMRMDFEKHLGHHVDWPKDD